MSNRIIAINSNCYHGYSIEEAIRGIAAAGFRYIELTATKGWTEHVFPDQSFEILLHVKDLLKEYNLTPYSMSGHCNLMDRDRIGDFIKNIRMAAFFGCKIIVSSVGEAHLKDREKADLPTVAGYIRELVPALEENGLTLVLETHGEHGTGAILSELVTLIGSERVKVCYDTANVVFYGRVKPEEDICACMENLRYIHLKDKGGAPDVWDFPALGEGWINFPAVFEELKKADNQSPFSIEIEFTPAGASLDEVNRAVRVSGEYLKNHGFEL